MVVISVRRFCKLTIIDLICAKMTYGISFKPFLGGGPSDAQNAVQGESEEEDGDVDSPHISSDTDGSEDTQGTDKGLVL